MSNPVIEVPGKPDRVLWQVQSDTVRREGEVDVNSITTTDSGDTVLTTVTQKETIPETGIVTARRLSTQTDSGFDYSDDRLRALSQWVQRMENLIQGEQGGGYTLDSTERNRRVDGVISKFQWSWQEGQKYQINYQLAFERGRPAMASAGPTYGIAEPVDPEDTSAPYWTLDGNDLQYPESIAMTKQQQIGEGTVAMADTPDQNVLVDDSGAVRTVTITGKVTGDKQARNSFDNTFFDLVGQDQVIEFSTFFPGYNIDVAIRRFEPTREAGWTDYGEYALELVEGFQ